MPTPLQPAAAALQAGGQYGAAAAGWAAYQQPGVVMAAAPAAAPAQAFLTPGQPLWNGQQQQVAAAAQWGQQVGSRGDSGDICHASEGKETVGYTGAY